jgi:hypothetical protein
MHLNTLSRPAVVFVVLATATGLSLGAQDARVTALLERGRLALAGGTARALPGTFVIIGERTDRGDAGKPYSFEIHAELPDKFIWKQNVRGRGAPVRRGFDGNRLITDTPQDRALNLLDSSSERADVLRDVDQLKAARAQFSALTLGLFAASFRSAPLTFADVPGGQAANAIGISGRDGFGATLVFDPHTGLPAWLGYREFFQRGILARRWVYEDYRNVAGRMVPHQLTWMQNYEEDGPLSNVYAYSITAYRFDVPIDPKLFKK